MKKKLALILTAIMIVSTLCGCSQETTQTVTEVLKKPEIVEQYFEDYTQDWPDAVQDVVDDAWNEFTTVVTTPDYTPPAEQEYIAPEKKPVKEEDKNKVEEVAKPEKDNDKVVEYSGMEIHFIDVGQADCIVILDEDEVFMIDAGNNGDDDVIVQYLEALNIDTIDHFVLTHPHEDHIGSADVVINTFDVENVYMTEYPATSKTYKDVITAINNAAIAPHYVDAPINFEFGDAIVDMYPPFDINTDNVNDSSIVVKFTHGEDEILLAGDTEIEAEKGLLTLDYDLSADLFKANHHGSGGANSYVWLKEVNPQYVVIQCGVDNKYDHPHDEALSRFNDVGAIIYRNDTMGTIVATSSGNGITFDKEGIQPTRPHTN